ncbi:MAG TPA: ATP synthase F1 subunit delta [Lacipirellulaceae bacterium]|nr:ATP synthase F1 subunit delta [Lacipirellulaceae bacterium]HMP06596.1 ATP synthase F1 subunit delta [Lacipirellulaceae bacterium]
MGEFIHVPRIHDTVFDVSAEQLARVYAKSALDASGGPAEQDALMGELEAIRDDVLGADPRAQELFASQLISKEDKAAMLDRLLAGRVSPRTLHTLHVINRHGRLGMIRDVVAAARKIWETRSGRQPVELETAFPLAPDVEQEVMATLAKTLNADPIIHASVNPDLIAGFIIRVGDRVYDGSVRTRLEAVRKGMIVHATEAIQTTPHRFFDSEIAHETEGA